MSIVSYNNRSIKDITDVPAKSLTLIKTLTASSSSDLTFVDGASDVVLDDTYPIYLFTFNNIHASHDGGQLSINGSIDTGSNYNVAKTTTLFAAQHDEADSDTSLAYNTSKDLAQGTGDAVISFGTGNANDEATSGYLHLFNPSSTTFVKHFISNINTHHQSSYSIQTFVGGYFNTASAIDAIRFDMDNGTMDSGTIKLYGLKDS
jgi:hypothetical protein